MKPNAHMETVPFGLEYSNLAGTWKVIRRNGRVIMAKHKSMECYEVFRLDIKVVRHGPLKGIALREHVPPPAQWGTAGYSCMSLDRANVRFMQLVNIKAAPQKHHGVKI